MNQTITILPLKVPGYLVTVRGGFVLIDCSDVSDRQRLDQELARAGVKPGNLKLVLLTHGDFDHSGNAAFLQHKYAAKIAMQEQDAGMVTHADMGWNRKVKCDRITPFGKAISLIARLFVKKDSFETFTPDVYVEDGQDLAEYGLAARVISLPGHSKGSIGILTAGNVLFCGDLLMNMVRPELHFMIDDIADCSASLEKLKGLPIGAVYPGHGKPFAMTRFLKEYR
jgi:glyoxylase-like metal-dependent hydrolase (beta-lactamase superfamily II)